MLDAHPDIAVTPETHFVRRFWEARALYGEPLTGEGRQRLISDVAAMPEFAEFGLSAADLDAALNAAVSVPDAMRRLLGAFGRVGGATIIGEKTPSHATAIPLLAAWFPDAVFIHLVRDPRAVVASLRGLPWSSGSLEADAAYWRRTVSRVRKLPGSLRTRLTTVRFEAMVADPRATLERLTTFLQVHLDSAMLNYHSSAAPTLNVKREPWKQRALEPVQPAVAVSWQNTLTSREIERIETEAWPEMARWGYSARSPSIRRLVAVATRLGRRILGPQSRR